MSLLRLTVCFFGYWCGRVLFNLGRFDAAAKQFEFALTWTPEFLPARAFLAGSLMETGSFDRAIAQYRELVVRTPESSHAHLGLGTALARARRYEEAIGPLRVAAEKDPENPVINYNLGASYFAAGKIQDALVAYRRAVKMQPNDPEFMGSLGAALGELRHWDDAVSCLQRALSLKPEFNVAHSLGVALYELRKYCEAEDAFRLALRLGATPSANSTPPETGVRLALAVREQGRHHEALAILHDLEKTEPANGTVLVALADTYLVGDRVEEALKMARAAVALDPGSSEAHVVLGWALIKEQSTAAARDAFGRAIELAPDDLHALAGLGAALSALGEHTAALRKFDLVVYRDPDYLTHWPEIGNYMTASRTAVTPQVPES